MPEAVCEETERPDRPPRLTGAPLSDALDPSARSGFLDRPWAPLGVLAIGLLFLAAARIVQIVPWIIPRCGLRTLTGIPCPFCGTTRSLVAWSHLDVAQAIGWNPMVAIGFVAICAWALLRTVPWNPGRAMAQRVAERLRRRPWPALLLVTALANWIYLILTQAG